MKCSEIKKPKFLLYKDIEQAYTFHLNVYNQMQKH